MKINTSSLKISKLQPQDQDNYIAFENNVKAHMEHPEWLGPFSKEDYKNLLSNNSYIFIWTLHHEIVTSRILIPASQKNSDKFLSNELNFKEVVNFGPEMVNLIMLETAYKK